MSGNSEETATCDKGTLLYEPPEIFNIDLDEDLSKTDLKESKLKMVSLAYDVWSFGLIFCEIFGSMPVWGEEKLMGNQIMMYLINKKKYPIPKSIKCDDMKSLLEKCTNVYPHLRIPIKNVKQKLIEI